MSMPITSAVFVACAMTRLGSPAAIAAPPTPRSFATSRRLIQPCLSIIVLPDVVVFCRCAARPARDWSYQITASSRPSAAILELRRERLGAAREEADVGADGDEERAEREPAPRRLLAVGQDAGGLARLDDARDRIVDPRHHLGMGALARKAERGVEVGRPDEDAVDALDRGNLLEITQALAGFDLHHDADLVRRLLEIVLHSAEARRPRRAGDAAQARRRIARVGDGVARLVGARDLRDEQRLHADVEVSLH